MGFHSKIGSLAAPRLRGSSWAAAQENAFFAGEDLPGSWTATLSAAGVHVTPELAMTLSAYYCGVTTIAYDLATLPLRAFKSRSDGGKDLIPGSAFSHEAGIGALIYRLQWQPNRFQSAAEYFVGQLAQFLLRGKAYAEIVPGTGGYLDQLLPRHPDRITPERLPNGNLRYRLIETNGTPRYVTDQEMHVVRDLTTDGLQSLSRVQYGATAIGTGLAAERAAGKFFKSGMTAAMVATYKGGDMEDEDEAALHASISRYAAGVENSFGLLLVPDNVTINNLGVEPDKAQMMLAREWTVSEVARQLRISPRKLMARGKGEGYASAYQDAIDHVVGCLRPIAVLFQQAIQRDLVLAKDTYSFVFHLGELLKGDPAQMGDFIEKLISSRAMTPSEVRTTFLDMNASPELDKLSEGDNRPGQSGQPKDKNPSAPAPRNQNGRASLKAMLYAHDNAVRCLRREQKAVERLAKKHPEGGAGWTAGLRDFYREHAAFVGQVMRLESEVAADYVAKHGLTIEQDGAKVFLSQDDYEPWERSEAESLAVLALNDGEAA